MVLYRKIKNMHGIIKRKDNKIRWQRRRKLKTH
jgi:hypothetical protein